ncbi:MAG: hypothetical protein HYT22_03020 [Candidatus Niyogibacteria bacterium]|nr:hypothetical protein [Candidatus Niyogibacteria bacterium]
MLRNFVIVSFMLGAILAACNQANDPANVGKPNDCALIDYGKGVYYFPCIEADFGNALRQFRERNPGIEIEAMAGDGTGLDGINRGYFVTVRFR